MESGKKAALGATVLLLAVVGVRVGMIYLERHAADATPAPTVASKAAVSEDAVCLLEEEAAELHGGPEGAERDDGVGECGRAD